MSLRSIATHPLFLALALIPLVASAQVGQFVPLVPDFPQIAVNSYSLPNALNAFYAVAVGVAGLLAVIMVSIGGFKYMMSESVFSKSDAKEQITDALIGLGIVLGAVLLLNVINPELTNLDILRSTPQREGVQTQPPTAIIGAERALHAPQATPAESATLHTSMTFEGPECLPRGSQTCTCPSTLGDGVVVSKRGESPCRYSRGGR